MRTEGAEFMTSSRYGNGVPRSGFFIPCDRISYPLGRPRRRWVDNIKMDLREIGWDGVDWIDLAQDRDQWRSLVNMVMNLWIP
jgi:hypothetical protein